MDRTEGHYIKWNKPDTKTSSAYSLTYMNAYKRWSKCRILISRHLEE
jgi:hypothetical protein